MYCHNRTQNEFIGNFKHGYRLAAPMELHGEARVESVFRSWAIPKLARVTGAGMRPSWTFRKAAPTAS